jgi:general secretion pathway protein G
MHRSAGPSASAGFTLVELMAVVGIIAALAALAIPIYSDFLEKARRAVAISDIRLIAGAIEQHFDSDTGYPRSLADLGSGVPAADPWGNPYVYLPINILPAPNRGELRKDKNLVPLNSDYDLYSMGRDGRSQKPLTAAASRDDIVRAGNGSFIGIAKDH